MTTATVKELKEELKAYPTEELLKICLRLAKFKKENKELLTYLLFEASDQANYIENIKVEIKDSLSEINTRSYYYINKSIRKILRTIKKYIRFSQNKETEVEVLIYFCQELNRFSPSIHRNTTLKNIYYRQIRGIEKAAEKLHPDLQFDYAEEIEELTNPNQ